MERRPEFTVIAGPNGAGKSRLCPFYVSIKSFDGDKLALNLRNEHPDWPEHWISGTVASELEKQKNSAIEHREDFAFETNFSNEMVINMIQEFKEAGYKVSLCYFGLYSEDESVSRVILRSQTGGHDVTDEVIRFNFNEGLKKAKKKKQIERNSSYIYSEESKQNDVLDLHSDSCLRDNHTRKTERAETSWLSLMDG